MAVRQVKENEWTKDGRKWIFEVRYNDLFGEKKYYKSKKYLTKKEAQKEERKFLTELDSNKEDKDMTFNDLCEKHFEYQKDKVKGTTLNNYKKRREYFKMFDNIKLVNLDINHFEEWKKNINNMNLATTTKNDLYKYLKCILNYGIKWYNYNFSSMYNKMTNFNNPNEMPKEMSFWTKEEFDKFISVETDAMFKTAFQILYFCGLRCGELLGLTWEDIDVNKKELTVRHNIVYYKDDKSSWHVSTPKTKSSYRTLPLPDIIISNLIELKSIQENYYGYNEKWFVFGTYAPIRRGRLRERKVKNCKLARVKEIRLHDFRHSCASLLINNNANITMVAKYLGHTKIDETLNTYSHMFKNKLDDIVGTINELNKQ